MRTEAKLFLGLGIFMLPLGLVYWFVSYERAGSILLIVVALAFAYIGVYLALQAKRMNGLRPEDYDADPQDGVGPVGSFPAGSIYPFIGAMGVTLVGFGLTFSMFLAVPGFGLILITIIGMARESEIGELHHEDLDHNAHVPGPGEKQPGFSDNVAK